MAPEISVPHGNFPEYVLQSNIGNLGNKDRVINSVGVLRTIEDPLDHTADICPWKMDQKTLV